MVSASLLLAMTLVGMEQTVSSDATDSVTGNVDVLSADSLMSDLPESMSFDVDSLMELWFAKQYMSYDSDCIDGSVNPVFSDSVYAARLNNLPTIVEIIA